MKCIMNILCPPQVSAVTVTADGMSSTSSSCSSSIDDDYHRQQQLQQQARRHNKSHPNNNNSKQYGQCPVCQSVLQIGDIFPAPYVDKKILTQIVRCLYHNKGCLWTGSITELSKKASGHLKQCGYSLFRCKYCKKKIVRNKMVQHQNDECKSNYMICPYSMYGCNFQCRIREMDKHCQLNELQHVKLKLDYLENQLFIPEIIKLKGMSAQYIEANGKYYLINKHKKSHSKLRLNASCITYKKNGGYTLEFNHNECIWHLRSMYYGLIAYGIPKNANHHQPAVPQQADDLSMKQLNTYMNDNCVWSVYTIYGDKQSLVIDENIRLQPIQLSQDVMKKWNLQQNDETDTEEINGEFEQNFFEQDYDAEGVVNANNANHGAQEKRVSLSNYCYQVIFGNESAFDLHDVKRQRNVTRRKLEIMGIMALTGVTVYYLWSKFGRSSHAMPAIHVLPPTASKSGVLVPKLY